MKKMFRRTLSTRTQINGPANTYRSLVIYSKNSKLSSLQVCIRRTWTWCTTYVTMYLFLVDQHFFLLL